MSSYKRYILCFILLFIYNNTYAVQNLFGECDIDNDGSCQFNKIYNNKFSIKEFIELDKNGECYPFQDYDKKYEVEYNNSIKTIKKTKNLRQKNNKDRMLQLIPKLHGVTINNSKESIQYQTVKNLITLIPSILNKNEIIDNFLGDDLINNVELFLNEIDKQSTDSKYIKLLETTHTLNNSMVNLAQEYLNECDNDNDCKKGALLYTQADSNLAKIESMTYISPKIVNKYECQNNPNLFLCVITNMHSEVKHNISNTITKFSDSLQDKYFKSVDIVNQLLILKNKSIKDGVVNVAINLLSYDNELRAISKLGYFANNNFGGRKKSLDEENENIFNTIIKTTSHLSYQARLDKYQTEVKNNIFNHITILNNKIKKAEIYRDNILKDLKRQEQVTRGIVNIFNYLIDIVKDINNIIREFFVVES